MSRRTFVPIAAAAAVWVLASAAAGQYCCEYAAGCFDASGPGDTLCGEYQGTIVADATCDYGTGNCAPAGPGYCSLAGPDPACDDGDPCTADLCVDGRCQNPPNDACGLKLEKSDGGDRWTTYTNIPLDYTLTVRTGAVGASVVLREIVPASTTFAPEESSPGWTCEPDTAAGATCTFPIGEIGPGETHIVDFVVRVAFDTDPAFEIFNEATVPEFGLVATTVTKSEPIEPDPCEDDDYFCAHTTECFSVPSVPRGPYACTVNVVDLLLQKCPKAAPARAVGGAAASAIDRLLLYRLRDRVFAGTAAGRRATELYYRYSPALSAAAAQNFDVVTTAAAALAAWGPVFQALVDGRGDAVKVTRDQIERFQAFLAAVRPVANPGLLAALEREVMLVDPASFAKRSAAELLRYLERLSFDIPSAIDPFHCYGVKPSRNAPKFQPVADVAIVNPGFAETVRFDVRKPRELCAPADKDGEGIKDPATHLERYAIKPGKGAPKHTRQRGLAVATGLGLLTLDTVKPTHLMVPTAQDPSVMPPAPVPAAHEVDHYACYAAKISKGAPKLAKRVEVTIGDQLTDPARRYLVKKPTSLCVPVEKNGEAVKHPTDHLVCYQVKAAKRRCAASAPANPLRACRRETDCGGTIRQTTLCAPQAKHAPVRGLHTHNQFGPEMLDALRDGEICLPGVRFPT